MTWRSLSHLQRIHKGHGGALAELKLPNGGGVPSRRHSHEQLISTFVQQAGSRAAFGCNGETAVRAGEVDELNRAAAADDYDLGGAEVEIVCVAAC
jgi:hypothetical protein